MKYDIIEAEYTDLTAIPCSTVSPQTVVTMAKPVVDVVNNITNSIKEYKITQEEERTKRLAIKSHLKQELAKIDAFKEVALTMVNDVHAENMKQIDYTYQESLMMVETMCQLLREVVKTGDIELIKVITRQLTELNAARSEIEMKLMDNTCNSRHQMRFLVDGTKS